MDYALGEVGLLPKDFWRMSWPEYERACRGYETRRWRQWEHTRELLTQQANLNRDPKKQPRPYKASKYLPLPTDPPAPVVDTEGMRAFRERMIQELRAKNTPKNGHD